jgi:hypothetical protein
VPELLALKAEVETEREELCHGDFDCEEEFRWNLWERGAKYQALEMFDSMSFMATNINLERETITLRYAPYEDPFLRHLGITQEPDEIGEAYMFWLEDGMIDPTVNTSYNTIYVNQIIDGNIDNGLHVVMAKNQISDGENWLPIGEEIEFSIAGSNLASSQRGIIFDKIISDNPDHIISMGVINYQGCIDSPDYQPGMDCRLMFDSLYGPTYLPVEPEEPEELQEPQEPRLARSSGLGSSNEEPSSEATILKAPDTGVASAEKQGTAEYLIPIAGAVICALLGVLLILGPRKSPKTKKFLKKSKKSLDIFNKVR